jgi:hypothetical protein
MYLLESFRFHILLKTFKKCYYSYKDLVYQHNSAIKDLTKKGYFPFMILQMKLDDEKKYRLFCSVLNLPSKGYSIKLKLDTSHLEC